MTGPIAKAENLLFFGVIARTELREGNVTAGYAAGFLHKRHEPGQPCLSDIDRHGEIRPARQLERDASSVQIAA
jgi:hypothetical protein